MRLDFPFQAVLTTPFSLLGIHCTQDVLTGITFLPFGIKITSAETPFAKEVCVQILAYLDNADYKFDLPLNLPGTAHQVKVWAAMRAIPRGEVLTYGELAKSIHSSPRAVGQACGNNPIPIVVPCHRVVSKTGLGGFIHSSENTQLDIKRWLLAHEQH